MPLSETRPGIPTQITLKVLEVPPRGKGGTPSPDTVITEVSDKNILLFEDVLEEGQHLLERHAGLENFLDAAEDDGIFDPALLDVPPEEIKEDLELQRFLTHVDKYSGSLDEPREDELAESEIELEDADDDRSFRAALRAEADTGGTIDALTLWLDEAGRVPLLTTAQEVSLAKRMEKAITARKRLARGKVTPQKRALLEATVEDGWQAREHLIGANFRLVISIAKRYMGRGVPFMDLIQEGNVGLLRGVKKFDYHRGYKFSTYATWWIRQAVTRALADQSHDVRLPSHIAETVSKVHAVMRRLTGELGRSPTAQEIADEFGMPDAKKVAYLLSLGHEVSMETPVGPDDAVLGDFIPDESPDVVAYATRHLLREDIDEALESIPPRYARILRMRYGLLDGYSYMLEEVGRKMGLTRERIRQIEGLALSRLRHLTHRRKFRDYLRE